LCFFAGIRRPFLDPDCHSRWTTQKGAAQIAAKIVPDQAETILRGLGWVRGLGIAVLTIFEGMAFVAAMRILFGDEPDAVALERQGIPPLLVKLMLAEARFWRWVWSRLRSMK
jgi:hypothetical protein